VTAQEYPVFRSHLGIIYFDFVTPSFFETVSRWETVNQEGSRKLTQHDDQLKDETS
jgi:hypothetical protein